MANRYFYLTISQTVRTNISMITITINATAGSVVNFIDLGINDIIDRFDECL